MNGRILQMISGAAIVLCGAQPAAMAQQPLQTELVGVLDVNRAKVGSAVLLRVDVAWAGAGCTLKVGSIVQGKVVDLTPRSKSESNSHLTIAFEVTECARQDERPSPLVLEALIGGAPNANSGVTETTPLADVPGLAIGGGSSGGGSLRSAESAASLTMLPAQAARNLPQKMLPGQVIAISGVTLKLPGAEGDTVIFGMKRNLRLEPTTRFILVAAEARRRTPVAPATEDRAGAGKTAAAEASVVPVVSAPEPADEMDICEGTCGAAGEDNTQATSEASKPVAQVSLTRMGYAPRLAAEVTALDYETTLTWLDGTHLLCTFDPHQLRSRSIGAREASRVVEGVVIDATNYKVQRSIRWRVIGERRYLWPVSDSGVLIHVGSELRMLNAELKPEHAYAIQRPIAWISTSPNGERVAVGLLSERHSESLHEELKTKLQHEPEEDVDVVLLDRSLTPLAVSHQSSASPTPVMTDAGELRVKSMGRGRWKISEYSWSRMEHDLVVTKSMCRPTLSAQENHMIFAVGCTAQGGHWYRMLRPDGHPVLKGVSTSSQFAELAQAAGSGAFAVGTLEGRKARTENQPFRRDDLEREQISIYETKSGSRRLSVNSDDFTLAQQGWVLSPDGSQLANAGSHSVLFYAVPGAK